MDLAFAWKPERDAQRVLDAWYAEVLGRSGYLRALEERMRVETGTRLFDWLDCLLVPDGEVERLVEVGFELDRYGGWRHPGAVFPRVVTREVLGCRSEWGAQLKVDACVDFAAVHGVHGTIQGKPWAPVRRLVVTEQRDFYLSVVERHGSRAMEVLEVGDQYSVLYQEMLEYVSTRRRNYEDMDQAFAMLEYMLKRLVGGLGQAVAADCFFRAERKYWMGRNRVARMQYERQGGLGLGWANHDHHTYRSSRRSFSSLVGVLEMLGLQCRERFYAGAGAGWGAQVLESGEAGIVVFADVDMSAEEVRGDFSHQGLGEKDGLGTVGMWCALHGESLFQAGMHHLECQFDFEALARGLEEAGVKLMRPFSDLPYLKQQFTQGEWWRVEPERLHALLGKGLSAAEAREFEKNGALGSHLENLERRDGYKGFNQEGINQVIAETDPRIQ
ncbi:hypothetical protein [Rubritalea tangerina]|uniref:Uncharacterized protein n=1 Tax=Rubritalea tangerina TaxID=430798 RepID=A0ABW4Z6P6_9BACT